MFFRRAGPGLCQTTISVPIYNEFHSLRKVMHSLRKVKQRSHGRLSLWKSEIGRDDNQLGILVCKNSKRVC